MTLVELFEKDAIENICSSITKSPDRVILLGDKIKWMQRYAERYKAILQARGVTVDFICLTVNKNRMQAIVDVLSSIAEEYDDCVFDLTGGEDLFLVAAGVVLEKYRDKNIQMHRLNIRNSTIIDVDEDGKTFLENDAPVLSIEETIRIYGGDIVYSGATGDKTYLWDMTCEFKNDINTMWNICRQDARLWNTQICVIEAAEKLFGHPEELKLCVSTNKLKETVKRNGGKQVFIRHIIEGLHKAGLLQEYSINDNIFSLAFKNEQVKRCLTVAGQVLEMKVFLAALDAQEKDGSNTYNDVMNGVFIDWDGDIGTDKLSFDTENEIDVMMMHDMVPVFVSCKNGFIGKDELYKLNTVATRFGGKYAKKVLVATSLDNSDASNYIRQRAEDMGIRLVEGYSHNGKYKDFVNMNDTEINRVSRSLWSN